MYKLILQGIEHVEIWPIIALIIFMAVFIIGTIRAATAGDKFINHMKNLPLEDNEKENSIN